MINEIKTRAQNVPHFELVGAVSIVLNTAAAAAACWCFHHGLLCWWLQPLLLSSLFSTLVLAAAAIVVSVLCWHWQLWLFLSPSGPEMEVNERAGGLAPTSGGVIKGEGGSWHQNRSEQGGTGIKMEGIPLLL